MSATPIPSPSLKQRGYLQWYHKKIEACCNQIETLFITDLNLYENAPLGGPPDPLLLKSLEDQIDRIVDELARMLGEINKGSPLYHPMVQKATYRDPIKIPLLSLLAVRDRDDCFSVEKRWAWMEKLMKAGLSLDPVGLDLKSGILSNTLHHPTDHMATKEDDSIGMTLKLPLHCAIEAWDLQMVLNLIRAGADVHAVDEEGYNSLLLIQREFVGNHRYDVDKKDLIIDLLFDQKIDVHLHNGCDWTSELLAALALDNTILKKLYHRDVKMDQIYSEGNGLLHLCVEGAGMQRSSAPEGALESFCQTVQGLVQNGACLFHKNEKHQTPLECAISMDLPSEFTGYLQGLESSIRERQDINSLFESKEKNDPLPDLAISKRAPTPRRL